MTEQLTFHNIEELERLSLEELQALWELVPTDRQKSYRAAYDREVRNAGAIGSDALEARVAVELLNRYRDVALVPVGTRWARTPQRVQEAAQENDLPGTDTDGVGSSGKLSPPVIAIIVVMILIFVGFMLFRGNGSSGNHQIDPEVTEEPTITPTPEVSPTPTPLALEAQDDVITGGDSERAIAYPVNLQVVSSEDDAPRVWVVQRRGVDAAEWNFDPNPDIASFVNGMSVRPVIGIPWSEGNADFFAGMDADTVFNLTMNTGAILRYEFSSKTEVLRSDTRIFRQVGPGLVLLLIGETDEDGLPSGTRTLVTATYPPEQELSRLDGLITQSYPQLTPEPTEITEPVASPVPFAGIDVQLIEVTMLSGQITTHLWIYNEGYAEATFTQEDIWLALGYAENPPGPRNPAEGLEPFTLLPGQAVDLTLVWAWNDEPYAALQVGEWRFAIQLAG